MPSYHNLEVSDVECRARDELKIPIELAPDTTAPVDPASRVSLDRHMADKEPGYLTSYMHMRMANQAKASLNTRRVGQYLSVESGRQRIREVRKANQTLLYGPPPEEEEVEAVVAKAEKKSATKNSKKAPKKTAADMDSEIDEPVITNSVKIVEDSITLSVYDPKNLQKRKN